MDTSAIVSIVWAVLFVASTVVNIFLSWKLSKLENSLIKMFQAYVDLKIKEQRDYVDKEVLDLRAEFHREVDKLEARIK